MASLSHVANILEEVSSKLEAGTKVEELKALHTQRLVEIQHQETLRQENITNRQDEIRLNVLNTFLESEVISSVINLLSQTITETLGEKSITLNGWEILEGCLHEDSVRKFISLLSESNQTITNKLVEDLISNFIIIPKTDKIIPALLMDKISDAIFAIDVKNRTFEFRRDPETVIGLEKERLTEAEKEQARLEEIRNSSAVRNQNWTVVLPEQQHYTSDESESFATCCVSDDDPRNHHVNESPGEALGRWRDSYRQFD